jgi:response regulator RpfG family c-di-GMP phosphodiesterase
VVVVESKSLYKPADPEDVSLRILLVDDEPHIREALSEFLTTINQHQVVTAGNGEEALGLFKPDEFDCAFLDLKMPGMDGIGLLTRLKEADQSLPVVVMTGFPSLDAAVGTMRQGASDFLIKPFSLQQVKATLERVVREQRLLRENLRLNEELKQKEKIESLNKELEKRIKYQNTIHQISEKIDLLQKSEELYQGIADLAAFHLAASKVTVLVVDRVNDQLLIIAVHGLSQEVVGRTAGTLQSGICGKVANEGEPMIGQPGQDLILDSILELKDPYLCQPIKIRDEVFGVMVATEKRNGQPFSSKDLFLGRFLLSKSALAIENIALYESMVADLHSTLLSLVGAMEAKDSYTRQHSRRVTSLSVLTAQRIGLDLAQIESLQFAAYLHDIGKIGIKDMVLLKEGKLTTEEYEHIKQHPVIGESITKAMDLTDAERSIIRHHHESWDGRGYPDGFAGEEIPLLARIVAVADAFDAMTTDRPYRVAKSRSEAVEELETCSGKQFDPEVVRAFLDTLSRYHTMEELDRDAAARDDVLTALVV